MRIFAIETVYRSHGSKTPGTDGVELSKENLLGFLDMLGVGQLLKYKSSRIREVFIPQNNSTKSRSLSIPTIGDRIVQTLFVQVLEPIIDPHADVYSYGYRKGRNAHQAIGELSRNLQTTPHLQDITIAHRYLTHPKYLLLMDIEGFWGNMNRTFLLENYPMPYKFNGILDE